MRKLLRLLFGRPGKFTQLAASIAKGIEGGTGVDAAQYAGGRATQRESLHGAKKKRKKKRKARFASMFNGGGA